MLKHIIKTALRKLRYYASIIASGNYSICPKCGSFSFTGKYCYLDGTRLIPRHRCTCGHPISKYDVFCQSCGIQIPTEVRQQCQSAKTPQ